MVRNNCNNLIFSYLLLRRLIGIFAFLLPPACLLLGYLFSQLPLQQSLSYYYYTNVRDLFIGTLICVAVFLITYKCYSRLDHIITTICGIACLGVAFFPSYSIKESVEPVGIFHLIPVVSNKVHFACAALFFILLAFNSLFLFTRTSKTKAATKYKRSRNRIYIGCGITILVSLVTMLVIFLAVADDIIIKYKIIFIVETIMLVSFGISWLVKGETLFKDPPGTARTIKYCKVIRIPACIPGMRKRKHTPG